MELEKAVRQVEHIGKVETKESIHVAFGVDKKFVFPMGLAMTSILVHNQGVVFHVFLDAISDEDLKRIEVTMRKYHAQCNLYYLDTEQFASLRTTASWSVATYFRIVAAACLPDDQHKVLYLDADTFCRKSIKDFYDTPLDDYYVGAVEDSFGSPQKYAQKRTKLDMGEEKYFNAGVLLINLDRWRENSIPEQAMDLLTREPEKWEALDQDVLNYLCKGKVKWFSCWYDLLNATADCLREAPGKAVIVHFTGPKPWTQWYLTETNPVIDKEYDASHALSAWADQKYWQPVTRTHYRLMSKRCAREHRFLAMLYWQAKYLRSKCR